MLHETRYRKQCGETMGPVFEKKLMKRNYCPLRKMGAPIPIVPGTFS